MNMISAVTGGVKHELIGWDTLPEIYTVEELKKRVNTLQSNPPFKLSPKFFTGITVNCKESLVADKIYYYSKFIYSRPK